MTYDDWLTTEPDPDRYERQHEQEDARERMWFDFEVACCELAASEPDGFAAVLRAVARAMKATTIPCRES